MSTPRTAADPKPKPRSKKREELVNAAERLIRAEGYRAAGLERILEEAGTAKMTLYNHFENKDAVLLEAAQRISRESFEAIRERVESAEGVRAKLNVLIDAVIEDIEQRDARGCVFMRSAAEFAEEDHSVRGNAAAHYDALRAHITELVRDVAREPEALAEELVQIFAGAFGLASMFGAERILGRTRAMAHEAVDRAFV